MALGGSRHPGTMKPRTAMLLALAAATLLLFGYLVRQLSAVSVGLSANREMKQQLRSALDDQKRLAALDPARTSQYRTRFGEIQRFLSRSDIIDLSRQRLMRTVEITLLATIALLLAAAVGGYILEQRRREMRLARLRVAIESLSRGEADIDLHETDRDLIGQIAGMIEETSGVMMRDRRRVQYLEHLSSWQEAARRHAHEIRTPLTAAQLEVGRLAQVARAGNETARAEIDEIETSIREEFDHLRTFTRSFVSFATVGEPKLKIQDLNRLLEEFCHLFATNWPNLTLRLRSSEHPCIAAVDREMIRQVLVNLCSNSALAIGATDGVVELTVRCDTAVTVEVRDSGPGIAPDVRSRIFEPYTTTRKIGEGMGLGLAISKKIMLDHGGDLELLPSDAGARFCLTFPRSEGAAS
jgi:two-component system, NtrC family, nitrogen regulation sensor histidine kinase NtrY